MAMTLIADNTADTTDLSATAFTSGLDNTYKLYIFKFWNMNPATDGADWEFQCSTDGGSNYNVTATTTVMHASHDETDDNNTAFGYRGSNDKAQSTDYMLLAAPIGNGGDESASGELFLFNPSDTTYTKYFYSTCLCYDSNDAVRAWYTGGTLNTTSAIDAINFQMSSGNFDGTVKMFGVG